jgi:hypothetical protein
MEQVGWNTDNSLGAGNSSVVVLDPLGTEWRRRQWQGMSELQGSLCPYYLGLAMEKLTLGGCR